MGEKNPRLKRTISTSVTRIYRQSHSQTLFSAAEIEDRFVNCERDVFWWRQLTNGKTTLTLCIGV